MSGIHRWETAGEEDRPRGAGYTTLPASFIVASVETCYSYRMRLASTLVMALVAASACSRAPEARQYELKGQILAVRPERSEVVIRHEDIKGFMPGMTMPFKVRDKELL